MWQDLDDNNNSVGDGFEKLSSLYEADSKNYEECLKSWANSDKKEANEVHKVLDSIHHHFQQGLFLVTSFVLYCIVLYCIVLYCIVLYCIVLYCIVLYCIVLYCIALHCIRLYSLPLYQISFYHTKIPFTVRKLLKTMGDNSGVPIEPDQQTRLIDSTVLLPGVVMSGVPGAGGYDSLFCLVRDTPEDIKQVTICFYSLFLL